MASGNKNRPPLAKRAAHLPKQSAEPAGKFFGKTRRKISD
jgi:hypothetical protein